MKFTSEDLMKAMGLQVGDYVRIKTKELEKYTFLVDDEDGLMLVYEDYEYPIGYLLDHDYEILPRPKRVGDLKCEDLDCTYCPMKCLNCLDSIDKPETIYGRLERWFEHYKDQEVYNLFKARLHKEVSE
jgi:hypothetical protein